MEYEEMTFGQLLEDTLKEAKIKNKTLAENINNINGGISIRQVQRWLADKYMPQNREWILDMIKPLSLKKRGIEGVKIANLLLQKSGHQELTEAELKEHFKIPNDYKKSLNVILHLIMEIKELIPFLSTEKYCKIDFEDDQIDLEKIEAELRLIKEGLTITHKRK